MRISTFALLAASCLPSPGSPVEVGAPARAGARGNVNAARELDQQGVRSFRDGRYADAAQYFRMAYDLGGPSSELWNLARCQERLDDPEAAAASLQGYLARRDLSPQDRSQGERELQALRTRPSMLTVTTTPDGAAIALDGKPVAGQTPVTVEMQPGTHDLVVRRQGYAVERRSVEARLGRAVILSLDLVRAGK